MGRPLECVRIWVLLGVAVLSAAISTFAQEEIGTSTLVIIPVEEDATTAVKTEDEYLADSCECKSGLSGVDASTFPPTAGLVHGTDLSLLVALPLTFNGNAQLSPGFFQLASALMAIDHFNARNPAIVPELSDLEDCPVRMDYESLQVLDTGTIEHNAMRELMAGFWRREGFLPHAIVGPYNEIPALELSVVASTLQIPMVTHRGLDHNLLLPNKHPFVTQINPDLYADMAFLGDYLQHTGRTDYIAVLYASNADSAIQRLEVFRGIAQALGMKNVKSFGYHSRSTPMGGEDNQMYPAPSVRSAVRNVKKTGFRTIVWFTPYFHADLLPVGDAAHKNGLDRGDHFWVIGAAMEIDRPLEHTEGMDGKKTGVGSVSEDWDQLFMDEAEVFDDHKGPPTPEMINEMFNSIEEINFMRNGALLRPAELFNVGDPTHSPFLQEWTHLNETFTNRLVELNPVHYKEYRKEWMEYMLLSSIMGWADAKVFPKGAWPPKDLFSNPVRFLSSPPPGALHLYDAVMAVGVGACKAHQDIQTQNDRRTDEVGSTEEINNITWTGQLLQDGIRSAQFTGASGEVLFGNGFPGSRKGTTITYHVVNLFPDGFVGDLYSVSKVRNATDGQWYEIEPFIYAGGATSPPELLRDPANQNYLSKSARAAGLTLMGLALLAIVLSCGWVAVHRHHSTVVASQPIFLYFLCMGCALTSLAILFLSFDESHGLSQQQLTRNCKTVPWLITLGHIWTYNCLFTKLWRVNRVLQFSRRQVNLSHVIWPAWLIEMAAIILLACWTATSDMKWERIEVDDATGETMGKCEGGEESALWIPICVCLMIPSILTGIMAWKTIDVDAVYSEAKWIFTLMLVQCQVIFVAAPLVLILEDVSSDGRFLGSALILWTFPATTIGLIMVPKMIAVHFPEKGHPDPRGSSVGVRVSGLTTSLGQESARASSSVTPFHGSNVHRASDASPMTQEHLSSLTQSDRHMHVTQI